ncbi:related to YHC3 - protein involved in vacuolar arginine transport [Pseudozyma flocculosa]|uniref:Protein BTN n=1 Tax=Pseudozyma flocculosa TaxID=84751 RepID=A0A5C3FE28_9BASI|nr:related to YHC3 - protein involved in vacuolar arginine transport [Pseudozyma flocculosa]
MHGLVCGEIDPDSRTAPLPASMWRTASASSPSAADGPPGRDHHHYHHRRPVAFLEPKPPISVRLNAAFFLFGLLNNSLYVVILTAALELLPQGVPTGLVSLANILPALVAKAVWPYVLKGTVRYTKRIWACAGLSFVGMMVISMFPSLVMRLLGISLASFSSGLGELTFLQLSTRYAPKPAAARGRSRRGVPTISQGNYAGDGVGWFASGTGAAGLVGAAAWWIVRPLGVQVGLGILSLLPAFMVGAYLLLLPSVESLLGGGAGGGSGGTSADRGAYAAVPSADADADAAAPEDDDDGDGDDADAAPRVDEHGRLVSSDRRSLEVVPEPVADSATGAHILLAPAADDGKEGARAIKVRLSFAEKMELLRPMLWPYILPLVTVYFSEYTINQGVAPTLIYPLPTRAQHPLLSRIIRKLSDYYPLYQLVYQTFVFISRSSVSILRLPAIPKRFLWLPAILQTALLLVLASESLHAWFRPSIASPLVIVLICIEGLAGGGAYVSVFYSIGLNEERAASVRLPDGDDDDEEDAADPDHPKAAYEAARRAQEHEFRIGCVGFGDSLGILVASLVSMPLQVDLCNRQVASGRSLCKQV